MTAPAPGLGTSTPLTIPNRHGRAVRVVRHDPPGGPGPVVLLTGGLGMTLRPTMGPALRLAARGFTVLRFVVTDAPGPSDGVVADFTMSGVLADVCDVADWAVRELGVPAVAVYAMSISGRAALRAPVAVGSIAALAVVSCVVDIRALMTHINGYDPVDAWRRLPPGGTAETFDLIGHPIRASGVTDMVHSGWSDEATTRKDLTELENGTSTALTCLVGSDDPWVPLDVVHRVFDGARRPILRVVPGMTHVPSEEHLDELVPGIADGFRAALGVPAPDGPAPATPGEADLRGQRMLDRAMERGWARGT